MYDALPLLFSTKIKKKYLYCDYEIVSFTANIYKKKNRENQNCNPFNTIKIYSVWILKHAYIYIFACKMAIHIVFYIFYFFLQKIYYLMDNPCFLSHNVIAFIKIRTKKKLDYFLGMYYYGV